MERLVLDADVFIDMLRGHRPAYDFILQHQERLILSVTTLTEVLAGFKSKAEESAIIGTASLLQKVPLTEAMAMRAGYLKQAYYKAHGCGIIDCMVAATAEALDASIVTLNKKHYPMLKGKVVVPYKK
ncbi:MAG: type II toxin-antitoxin system VapC family toxin [Rickettsiales bacterium]|jgi:predicted nucleic acid-binding protein|nr:type II toxin-antitoxin system VapC family toxin [Rickettsiales bacterium]